MFIVPFLLRVKEQQADISIKGRVREVLKDLEVTDVKIIRKDYIYSLLQVKLNNLEAVQSIYDKLERAQDEFEILL